MKQTDQPKAIIVNDGREPAEKSGCGHSPPQWIDTHAHLDGAVFAPGGTHAGARALARQRGVALCVLPAVQPSNWQAVAQLAHDQGDAYALGIHPLCTPTTTDADLAALATALHAHRDDPRLVAVGEIGLDFFVPALCTPALRARQQQVYRAQLKLARQHGLPVLLHVRQSADLLLKHLRQVWGLAPGQPLPAGQAGIAHAFNGSEAQAQALVRLGLCLGAGGAHTFDTARHLRHLAQTLPATAWVMETDAPDIPPQWLYATAAQRAAGQPQGINSPAELPRMGAEWAQRRGVAVGEWAGQTTANALTALPKLRDLLY